MKGNISIPLNQSSDNYHYIFIMTGFYKRAQSFLNPNQYDLSLITCLSPATFSWLWYLTERKMSVTHINISDQVGTHCKCLFMERLLMEGQGTKIITKQHQFGICHGNNCSDKAGVS